MAKAWQWDLARDDDTVSPCWGCEEDDGVRLCATCARQRQTQVDRAEGAAQDVTAATHALLNAVWATGSRDVRPLQTAVRAAVRELLRALEVPERDAAGRVL